MGQLKFSTARRRERFNSNLIRSELFISNGLFAKDLLGSFKGQAHCEVAAGLNEID